MTEAVTGLDLVAEQLRIAAGEPLATDRYKVDGHAVEVRVYAEDPRTFLPQTGRVERLSLPVGVRVDAGVEEGDEIGLAYDPMIAKLIARGRNREEALEILARALAETEVAGVTTNLPFLRWLVVASDRACRRGDHGVPDRASAPLPAPTPRDAEPMEPPLETEPAASAARRTADRRFRRSRARTDVRRERRHGPDARHGDPGRGGAGRRGTCPESRSSCSRR